MDTTSATVNIGTIGTSVCTNVYVTPNGGGDGSQSSPTNLPNAISMAMCNSTVIKMTQGIYEFDEPIQLSSYITLEGGYDPAWIKSSIAGGTTIQGRGVHLRHPLARLFGL